MRAACCTICLALLLTLLGGCGRGDIVAEGGDFVLTVDDLRYEVLNLGPSSKYEDTLEGRQAVVENLAARYYITEEAMSEGYGADQVDEVGSEAEATAVGKAYRRWKIDDRVLLPRIKTKAWMDKLDRRLYLKDLVFAVHPVAVQALEIIRDGKDFESVVESVAGRPDVRVNDPGWVIWKDLGRDVANVVFRLDVGQVSDIVAGGDGYHIFYLADAEKFGLGVELLSLRAKRFVRAMEVEKLEAGERGDLIARYDLRFSEPGVESALQAFAVSFEGGRPADTLMSGVLATYSKGEVLVAHPYNVYYAMSEQARPYVGDAFAVRAFTTSLILPRLEILAGYAAGLGRLREVKWAAKQAREDLLVGLMEEAYKSRIEVTPDDIATYYRERGREMVTSGRYRVRRILVDSEDEARQVLRQVRMGRDFAEVAKEMSKDQYTASNGGDLGFIHFGMIVPYDSIAAELEVGELSRPFETESGVEILKMEEKEPPRQLTFEEAEPYIVTFITNTRANEMLAEWVGKREAEVGFEINQDLLGRVSLPVPEYKQQIARSSEAEAESDSD
jgi:parvulin-like peptidyl-prolyl isomerase